MGACVWHRCVKARANVVLEWLQWRLGLWINLISSSAISPQPGNLKPPHSSNIQLFTISCLPEICVFFVNVKIMQQESFMLNSEVMIYALFSLKRLCGVEGYIELSCMTEHLHSNISRLNCGNISLD